MWLSDQDGGSRIGNAQQLSGEEPADGRCSRSAARDKDAGQALLRFSRSLRRRKPSMVASRITDTVVRITAAAVILTTVSVILLATMEGLRRRNERLKRNNA